MLNFCVLVVTVIQLLQKCLKNEICYVQIIMSAKIRGLQIRVLPKLSSRMIGYFRLGRFFRDTEKYWVFFKNRSYP